jgi:hypothetical protein
LLVAVPLRVGVALQAADALVFPVQYWDGTEIVVPGGERLAAVDVFGAASYALRWV